MLKFANLLFAALLMATLSGCGGGSGTSTASVSNPTARSSHVATLLSNGKVLIAGGSGSGVNLSSAELYNPSSGTFSETGNMSTPRLAPSATLLPNGKVLIAGGNSGQVGGGLLSNAELYDPSTGSFTLIGTMTAARQEHTATLLLSGKVLIAGGNGVGGILSSTEAYDLINNFTATGSM